MLKSYLTIAWRHLLKNKGYSGINIAGLGLGMAIALIIGLYIADEYSFDHYHRNHTRIAEIMNLQSRKHEAFSTNGISVTPMARALRSGYTDLFDKIAQVSFPSDHLVAADDKKLIRTGVWAEHEFPEMFTYHMVYGSISALKDPSTLMIAQSLSTALFGNTDPTGKTIRLDNQLDLTIGGVFEDLPANTTYHDMQLLLPWENPTAAWLNASTGWNNHNHQVWVQLAGAVTATQATARIGHLPTPHIDKWKEEAMVYPLDQLHLYDHFTNARADGGRINTVRLIATIGGFILLLACINFMNLSTARSERRAREVGIRKTVGSLRGQLIGQFLGESVLVAMLALLLAIGLAWISLPLFNALTVKDMHIPWTAPLFAPLVLGFTVFTGLLAGSYPAFYLSGFRPVKVLKGVFKAGPTASLPRQVLVVLQFTVSLTLIIGTVFIYRQVQYTKAREVGYSRDGLLSIPINTDELRSHDKAVCTELLRSGIVQNVAESSEATTQFGSTTVLTWEGKDPSQDRVFFRYVYTTPEFGKTIGWKILKGRDFSRDFATDSNSIILNDAAAKFIGFKDPIGKMVTVNNNRLTIIGISADMVVNSPYEPVQPAIFLGENELSFITVRLKPGVQIPDALAKMELIFRQYNPGSPFLYSFNDTDYARKFESEQRTGNLALVFASFAIFISCLGLFGLAAFVAEQRTKEIGVRKILGAGIVTLWRLLSTDFLKLTALSMFIAIPIASYAMSKWLEGYTYHTPMSWWIFAAACGGILLITLLTVSFQTLKAAFANPVRSLRAD